MNVKCQESEGDGPERHLLESGMKLINDQTEGPIVTSDQSGEKFEHPRQKRRGKRPKKVTPQNVQQMENNCHSKEGQFSKEPNQNYSLGPQRFNPIESFDDIMRNDRVQNNKQFYPIDPSHYNLRTTIKRVKRY